MQRALSIALALACLAAPAAFAGTISGTITYDGNVPKLQPPDTSGHPECGRVPNTALVLGDGNTLGNVLVRIRNAPGGGSAPSAPVVIDQDGCIYRPHITGVMAGQPLVFKNSDGILHNVHGLPKENREFQLAVAPGGSESVTLDKPEGPFAVKCDVHPWMSAYVAVMTHPYFAVTGRRGSFQIDGVPDGTYEIEAWHEELGRTSGSVKVENGRGALALTMSR